MKNVLCILGYHQKCRKVTNSLNWFVSIQFSNLLALLLSLLLNLLLKPYNQFQMLYFSTLELPC